VVNVQRGGPSTGLPTKTEQSDLLQAMYGRSGESPLIVIAASTPSNSFYYAYMACKLTLEFMTPVILLSDGYIANGSAPWKIKTVDDLPEIKNHLIKEKNDQWHAYQRDEQTLARTWAIPGTPGLEHRVGGLEKDSKSGNVSYNPQNHEFMTKLRAEKINRVQQVIPKLETEFSESGDLLVVGWGGTYGVLQAAVKEMKEVIGCDQIGFVHFNYINPLPINTEEIFKNFKKVIVCELNSGQMVKILKSNFNQIEFLQYNKIQGLPFAKSELVQEFKRILEK
jgi:2-oxoglutarate ferredoxin oxidoreductase subunit alpha